MPRRDAAASSDLGVARTRLRVLTIEIEGDANAVSLAIGAVLANVLRDPREGEHEPDAREEHGSE